MIIFVSDYFVEDYSGGGELTSEALIKDCPLSIQKIHSKNITKALIDSKKDHFWVFGNFTEVNENLLIHIAKNLNYSVLEYDYKFCKWRSIHKHEFVEENCNCKDTPKGKIVSIFCASAKSLHFMSANQRDVYLELYPFLAKNSYVLNSVFSDETLKLIQHLSQQKKKRNNKWIILNSQSWIKGLADCVRYARKNNLEYELVWGLSHKEMLKKMAESRGLIFLPKGQDTCPRFVIEAKLLGCELVLNDLVQHKDEEWFVDKDKIIPHLKKRTSTFWNQVLAHVYKERYVQKCDQFSEKSNRFVITMPTYNAESWIGKTLKSVKNQTHQNFVCYIINDCSSDSTLKVVEKNILNDKRFVVINNNKRLGSPIGNIYNCLHQHKEFLNDEDVVINLDGDDWFINENVLSHVNDFYNKEKCELTYGSFVRFSNGIIGQEASEYSKEVVEKSLYRQDVWRAAHLRTFKYELFKRMKKEYITNENGEFYEFAADQAMMYALLELSENSKFNDKVMYVYNDDNPLGIDPRTRTGNDTRRKAEILELSHIKQLRSHA